MKKLLALTIALLLLVFLPTFALGDETRSVSDLCQEVAQAESSGDMVKAIDSAFGALKAEARADEVRIAEVTPKVLNLGEDEDGDRFKLEVCTVTRDGKSMRYLIKVNGEPGASGYPLYISLHGGGTASAEENDTQWYTMDDYYRNPQEGCISVACRGMEDVWNMHSLPESYAMYDCIIEDMVLLKDVDPNRVYLLGFSAGGDGVYEVTPRMADRFAAANMSSGHPNDVCLLNVANVPFEIQVGVRDFYSPTSLRCVRGAAFEQVLSGYHDTYGFGFEHRVLVHVPEGHHVNDNSGADGLNAVVLKDPAAFARRAQDENWLQAFVDIYKAHYVADLSASELDQLADEDVDGDAGDDDAYSFEQLVAHMSYQLENGRLASKDEAVAKKTFADFNAAMTKKITGTGEGEYGMQVETVDSDAVHYVNRFTRSYCPKQLVWDLTMRAPGRAVSSFYWLKADKAQDKGVIVASFDAETNTFTLKPDDDVAGDFSVLINPRMVDVTRPVTFDTPQGNYTLKAAADAKVVEASLREVSDPYLAWVQEVSYQQLPTLAQQEPGADEGKDEGREPVASGSDVVEPVEKSAQQPASKPAASPLPKTGDTSPLPLVAATAVGMLAVAGILQARTAARDR